MIEAWTPLVSKAYSGFLVQKQKMFVCILITNMEIRY